MTVNSDATKTDWVDPDEAPELDDVWFDKADHYRGETLVQRGRPKGADKISTTIRFDADVLADIYRQRVTTRGKGADIWGWSTAYGKPDAPAQQPDAGGKS